MNGPVRNIDAWYAAFDVKPGDRLYVAPGAARADLVAAATGATDPRDVAPEQVQRSVATDFPAALIDFMSSTAA